MAFLALLTVQRHQAVLPLAEAVIGRVLHLETWPSVADVLWLGPRPCLVIGLFLRIRRRTQGTAGAAWWTPPP